MIAEDVTDRALHAARLCNPDGYRPERCPRCGHPVLHVHDYRERKLVGERVESGSPVIVVVRHDCADDTCGARWTILPRFVARHLWRSWEVVAKATVAAPAPTMPPVALRTRQRWWSRLFSAAVVLVTVLGTASEARLEDVAKAAGLRASRADLFCAYAARVSTERPVEEFAALVHRLAPGVRLM